MKKYIVREGDTLWSISQETGVKLHLLMAANPQIRDPNQIYPGMVIAIPEMEKGQAAADTAQHAGTSGAGAAGAGVAGAGAAGAVPPYFGMVWPHVVRPGETWASIARAYGVTVAELEELNPNLAGRPLEAGDILYLPASAVPQPDTALPPAGAGPLHPEAMTQPVPGAAPVPSLEPAGHAGAAGVPPAGEPGATGWATAEAGPGPAPWPAPPPGGPATGGMPWSAPGAQGLPVYPVFGPHMHYPFRAEVRSSAMPAVPAGHPWPGWGWPAYAAPAPAWAWGWPWTWAAWRPWPPVWEMAWDSSAWESSGWETSPGLVQTGRDGQGGGHHDGWSEHETPPAADGTAKGH
ncbi:LysM peptidoglycan-binding domain-containing protein [Alicyclobacillus cellulosilyticus]|uniref:LysM peptidoglycan-binding domain-containing protein n=1 Tax=Alicyclobacillus cellulosilyticus TaxID=1003997 RepID=UPI00166F4910|nr:LysM peptidoglycan-binding domain-containing protein [Alicyclobacillus cellulosilyticus]